MSSAPETAVQESVDHLFRHHSGQMAAVLARIFGLSKLEVIEDAVQDALVTALKTWPYAGFPENPQAWLIQVSKNKLLDRIRRDRHTASLDTEIKAVEAATQSLSVADPIYFANEVGEDQLRMIFACCHPAIAKDAQVALTLKLVGGFAVTEIASAFLVRADAMARMLSRAKLKLREGGVELEIPDPAEIPARLDAVLKVLYLMFNEGYSATEGDELVRADLCQEAIRLCRLLTAHPVTGTPKTHALAALFFFQSARLSSRQDEAGDLLLLSEQDQSQWDRRALVQAMDHFRNSASGKELSDYHLEAEIAACHALAPNHSLTDWPRIVNCYDLLQERRYSPVVELNRIIAWSKVEGTAKGLDELERLSDRLSNYHLFQVAKAHFLAEIGQFGEASRAYEQALAIARNEPVRRFLRKKIAHIGQHSVT
ncbi:MAG: DUF6596 domain-containing protein [Pyrinomonadaceae bacterium]